MESICDSAQNSQNRFVEKSSISDLIESGDNISGVEWELPARDKGFVDC